MIGLSIAVKNARLQALADALDAGPDAPVIQLYTATRPETAGATITDQALLVTLALGQPVAQSIDNGVLTLADSEDGMGVAQGAAAWARALDGAGAFVMDMNVGPEGSGADIELTSTAIYVGGLVRLTSAVIPEP